MEGWLSGPLFPPLAYIESTNVHGHSAQVADAEDSGLESRKKLRSGPGSKMIYRWRLERSLFANEYLRCSLALTVQKNTHGRIAAVASFRSIPLRTDVGWIACWSRGDGQGNVFVELLAAGNVFFVAGQMFELLVSEVCSSVRVLLDRHAEMRAVL